jgi:hypothetical protein
MKSSLCEGLLQEFFNKFYSLLYPLLWLNQTIFSCIQFEIFMTVLVYFVTFTYLLFALVIHVVSAQRKRKTKQRMKRETKLSFRGNKHTEILKC